jgi:L-alanine-DL-glutamate epimerase-like enolase superfamily enzyme
MTLHEIIVRRLELPLAVPYPLAYGTFEAFHPILIEVRDEVGGVGWGEGHVVPGSSLETPDEGWVFCLEHAARLLGSDTAPALAAIWADVGTSKVAATAMATAIEMLRGNPRLEVEDETRLALLAPVNAKQAGAIGDEVEERLAGGYATLKVKVGRDVDADLARVAAVQAAAGGRARLRVDANRGFDREQACRFAAGLDPAGIELFEQPCAAEDWEANAAVAEMSPVPVMLDEPICEIADIERAATIPGVGLCKLKLRRFAGLDRLAAALGRIRELGMEPVLGDGLAGDIGCWMEACVARSTITNAGEFNGFLKPSQSLLTEPMAFEGGVMVLPAGFVPEIDRARLAAATVVEERFAAPAVGPA